MSADRTAPPDPRPLLVAADEAALEELLRLCAAVDVSPVVATDVAAARRSWTSAPVVVVDVGLAADLARHAPDRRAGVHLVARAVPDPVGRPDPWRLAVSLGAEQVHVLPDAEDALGEALGASGDAGSGEAVVLAVVGGSGGAGATTVASAVAATAARDGTPALLVDLDPLGGGIDLAVGSEHAGGPRWSDLAGTRGRVAADSLRDALPRDPSTPSLSVLSWGREEADPTGATEDLAPDAVRSVLAAGRRSHGLVVIDVPRHLGAAGEEALLASHLCLVVVSADVRGVAAAARTLALVRRRTADVVVLVRDRGAGSLDDALVAQTLEAPSWGRVGVDRRLAAAVDDGLGPLVHRRAPVARCARRVVDSLVPADVRTRR